MQNNRMRKIIRDRGLADLIVVGHSVVLIISSDTTSDTHYIHSVKDAHYKDLHYIVSHEFLNLVPPGHRAIAPVIGLPLELPVPIINPTTDEELKEAESRIKRLCRSTYLRERIKYCTELN